MDMTKLTRLEKAIETGIGKMQSDAANRCLERAKDCVKTAREMSYSNACMTIQIDRAIRYLNDAMRYEKEAVA